MARGTSAARNLVEMFEATAARLPDRAATRQKREGRWVDTTWSDLGRRVRDIADGLAALGVKKGDRVSVIGETTTEWLAADLAVMSAGATRRTRLHSGVRGGFRSPRAHPHATATASIS
ncbi:MAG TPA: AMP-binding protein, partial [Anaeromyxobacteraceae bacterium]